MGGSAQKLLPGSPQPNSRTLDDLVLSVIKHPAYEDTAFEVQIWVLNNILLTYESQLNTSLTSPGRLADL